MIIEIEKVDNGYIIKNKDFTVIVGAEVIDEEFLNVEEGQYYHKRLGTAITTYFSKIQKEKKGRKY